MLQTKPVCHICILLHLSSIDFSSILPQVVTFIMCSTPVTASSMTMVSHFHLFTTCMKLFLTYDNVLHCSSHLYLFCEFHVKLIDCETNSYCFVWFEANLVQTKAYFFKLILQFVWCWACAWQCKAALGFSFWKARLQNKGRKTGLNGTASMH